MHILQLIKRNQEGFIKLCVKYKVDKLYAFGSSVTDQFDKAKSDIDLVIKMNITDPMEYGEALMSFWDEIESFFGKKVDLLTDESIKNPYLRKSIEATKKLIYDGQRAEVSV
ncbi:nucleotidyltransferase domain-containing protein [uncultured Imperialibacter sp.]|uniref:nucleotidyltransferase family protein n=1 Tax=uncultured Imperialibacter sp. TaxID=1672639 RepID=UPI0030DAA9D2|tara:strand:+ start:33932 stop:34267 length:336 start_codon:yes stop_codon:yes gene_type:complete